MLVACGSCGVRYSVPQPDAEFRCEPCRRAGAPDREVEEAPRLRSAILIACEKRAKQRDDEREMDRRVVLVGLPVVLVGLCFFVAGGWLFPPRWNVGERTVVTALFATVFAVYLWVLRKLASAMLGDPAPLSRCVPLAGLLMTMTGVVLALLGDGVRTGPMLAAAASGVFVFGVLVRYFLRLPIRHALVLTVGTGISTAVITVVLSALVAAVTGRVSGL